VGYGVVVCSVCGEWETGLERDEDTETGEEDA